MSPNRPDGLTDRVGRLLMVGFRGLEPDDHLRRMIEEFRVGGVILFRRNVDSADQVRELTGRIGEIAESAGYDRPILIAVDQEGGIVNRITEGVALSPGNMALGAAGDANLAREVGKIIGGELSQLGINTNLAPVLDLVRGTGNHLGTRCFGEDPELVGLLGKEYSLGLANSGVNPVGKHFLGYGGSTTDPHEALPRNGYTREELEPALEPFRIASDALVGVMSAHVVLEEVDDLPVTVSRKAITGILREEVGFDGPVVTDCLEMGAIQNQFGTGRAAVEAVSAGNDLLIVSHHEERQVEAIRALREAIDAGRLSAERVSRSLDRILGMAEGRGGNPEPGYSLRRDRERMAEVAGKGITVHRGEGIPLREDEDVLLVTPRMEGRSLSRVQDEEYENPSVLTPLAESGIEVEEVTYEEGADPEGILREIEGRDKVVILALEPEGTAGSLARRLEGEGVGVVLVALETPWGFDRLPADALLFTYGYRRASLEALGRVLAGEVLPRGSLPVSL